jgi:hypothetical protein
MASTEPHNPLGTYSLPRSFLVRPFQQKSEVHLSSVVLSDVLGSCQIVGIKVLRSLDSNPGEQLIESGRCLELVPSISSLISFRRGVKVIRPRRIRCNTARPVGVDWRTSRAGQNDNEPDARLFYKLTRALEDSRLRDAEQPASPVRTGLALLPHLLARSALTSMSSVKNGRIH